MFVLGNLLAASATVVDWLLLFWEIVVVVRVVLSWATADPYNPFVRAVHALSEPLLSPLRRLFPPWKLQGWDLSPFFAILTLVFLRMFVVRTLLDIASKLR